MEYIVLHVGLGGSLLFGNGGRGTGTTYGGPGTRGHVVYGVGHVFTSYVLRGTTGGTRSIVWTIGGRYQRGKVHTGNGVTRGGASRDNRGGLGCVTIGGTRRGQGNGGTGNFTMFFGGTRYATTRDGLLTGYERGHDNGGYGRTTRGTYGVQQVKLDRLVSHYL